MTDYLNWQQAVVGIQQRINPVLRAALDREDVSAALGLLQALRSGVVQAGEAPSRRLLHLVNLPAGSDINRLLVRIASLEREVRELRKRLEDVHDETTEPYL